LHRLDDLPTARSVELDGGAAGGDPHSAVSVVAGPCLQVREQQAANAPAAQLLADDHAKKPRRPVAPFLDVELSQADRSGSLTATVGRD